MSSVPPAPPPLPPSSSGTPSMEGGGIYFRWNGLLWQEQADGSYLVWSEETHQWEESATQPPPQPGETRETKECPNCGKRVKSTLRHCPYCEFGFEGRPVPTRQVAAPPATPRRKEVPSSVILLALGAVLVATLVGVFLFQRDQACANWRSAVDEITQATIELQGLPEGTSEQELRELNESLLAEKKPGGCE